MYVCTWAQGCLWWSDLWALFSSLFLHLSHAHAHTCPHMLTHAHTCTHMPTHMPTHAHTCPHMLTHAHTCTHMLTHAHTCPHMHTGVEVRAVTTFRDQFSLRKVQGPYLGFEAYWWAHANTESLSCSRVLFLI